MQGWCIPTQADEIGALPSLDTIEAMGEAHLPQNNDFLLFPREGQLSKVNTVILLIMQGTFSIFALAQKQIAISFSFLSTRQSGHDGVQS